MLALIDINDAYVSMERAMKPALNGRPVVVLSNSDGCCVSRSNEAKDLGVSMGAPWFQVKHLESSHGLIAASSNFELYADCSSRMMSLAAGLGSATMEYSIDEVFCALDGIPGDLVQRSQVMRARILQWLGLPTCIGIAATQTLAKLANHVAKSAERKPGSYPREFAQVFDISRLPAADFDAVLSATDVGEVWGVGRKIKSQLNEQGIATALDLARMDPRAVREGWSVVLERTVRELQGQPCFAFDEVPAPKQTIACTRTFGQPITELSLLIEAVSEYTSLAAQKLRKQGSLAGAIQVFIHTSPHRPGPRYAQSVLVPLPLASCDSTTLCTAAVIGLRRIYQPGFALMRAGIILLDLSSQNTPQLSLNLDEPSHDRSKVMLAMDSINARYGRNTLHLAGTAAHRQHRAWDMRQNRLTPRSTTRLSEIPVAKA